MRLSHRVHTAGSAADVWSLLGEPRRWPRFDVVLARVVGASGTVVQGQRLVGITRGLSLRIPIDVVRVVPHKAVQLRINAAPGMREEIEYLLVPLPRGGTQVRLTVDLDGPMARAATLAACGTSAMSADCWPAVRPGPGGPGCALTAALREAGPRERAHVSGPHVSGPHVSGPHVRGSRCGAGRDRSPRAGPRREPSRRVRVIVTRRGGRARS